MEFGCIVHHVLKNHILVTCGDWDLNQMLPHQFKIEKSAFGQKEASTISITPVKKWCNLKKVMAGTALGPKVFGMAHMLEQCKLKLEGRHHSGLDDCRNIARVLVHLCQNYGGAGIITYTEGSFLSDKQLRKYFGS